MEDNKANNKMIRLKSSDKEEFEVSEAVAMQSRTLRHMIEDDCTDGFIPLFNVTAEILAKVIEYCKYQVDDEANASSSKRAFETEKKDWEENFLDVDQRTLFEILMAANYMDIQTLLDLVCQKVAEMIKGKSTEEIRETFYIENDFTPEEEAAILKDNAWAFK